MIIKQSGISVVICTHNGRERLKPTLNSVYKQEFSQSLFELIVVDNASHDDTDKFCEELLSRLESTFNWKIVREEKQGLNYARLKGFRESNFEVVLFCDDDNALSTDYLKIAFELLGNNPQLGALGGCGIPAFEGKKPDWFDRYSHSFAVGPQSAYDGKVLEVPAELYGAGTFFRKAPLLNFFDRGFSPIMSDRKGKSLSSGGDVEWCYLIQLSGYEIWYDHRLTFLHSMPDSRMQWNYYLKLKEGIASGSGKLLPYIYLLKNRNMMLITFGMHWCLRALMALLVYCKCSLRKLLIPGLIKPEVELAYIVLRSKMNSYWTNGVNAFRHFQLLRKML